MASVLTLFHRSHLNPRMELFSEALVDDGNDVSALCWDRSGSSNSGDDVVPVTRIESSGFGMSLWNALLLPMLYLRFAHAILRRDPDVLLCAHISLLPLAVIVGRLTRTPVVYDVVETYYEGYRQRASPVAELFAWFVTGVEHLFLYGVSGITVIDTADDLLQDRYAPFTTNFDVVYNLPHVKPKPRRADNDGPKTIVYTGLVDERKGVPTLLEAFATVRETHDVELLVVGDSVDKTLTTLERRAEELELADAVQFVGRVPYDEVHAYLCEADIGVAPYQRIRVFEISRWNTRKIPDYMNAGLPIVAPDFGGFPEILEETACGVTVDTDSADALADGLQTLLDNPETARQLGENGRRMVEERYNWAYEREKVLDVVTQPLRNREHVENISNQS